MRACFLATLSLLIASSSLAQLPYTQNQVITYAKSIDVHMLDPSIPSQRLEDWLQSGPPHAHIYAWLVEDTCQLKPVEGNVDYPLCAEISLGRGGEFGQFLVQVGTVRSGISGSPKLYSGVGVHETGYIKIRSSERLSDLPAHLTPR
jgi:hypothetical protein